MVFDVHPVRGEDVVWSLHFSAIERKVPVQSLSCVYMCTYGKMLPKVSVLHLN